VTLVVSEYGEMFAWGCADDGALKLDSGEHSQLPSFVLPGSLSAQPRKEPVQGVRGAGICQHQRRRRECKECGGAGMASTSAEGANERTAGGQVSVRTSVEGANLLMQHLPAPARKKPIQGVRGGEHLPAPTPKKQMQGVPREDGRVDAGRPGGARGSALGSCSACG
jgi:hypothetical protein